MKPISLCIIGGHLTPALAVIAEIRKQKKPWSLMVIGRKYEMDGDKKISSEYRLIRDMDIPFYPITAGRLTRTLTKYTLLQLLKIPLGFVQALLILIRTRPAVCLSFGGYVALAVVIPAWILRIPIITHEQTLMPGLTNKIIALFSRTICVSFSPTLAFFPKSKTILTGLPIRSEILNPVKLLPFRVDTSVPLIYITGGTTGSVSMNDIMFQIIPDLVKQFNVIHQTGQKSYAKAQIVHASLGKEQKKRYIMQPYFDVNSVGYILHHAALVIGRSGANTVSEIAAVGVPALFIPLPWAASGEQKENARILENDGKAIILDQSDLTPNSLTAAIQTMLNKQIIKKHPSNKTITNYAASKVVEIVQRI